MDLVRYRDPKWLDFVRVCGPSRLGIRFRLAEYHAKKGGPWSYDPSHASVPLLTDTTISLAGLKDKFGSRLKYPAAMNANSTVFKLLLAEQKCRVGTVSTMPAKTFRIRRSVRLIVRNLYVRQNADTYSMEWLQPRVDWLTDPEFAFSARLFLEMFDAPEIRSHEFCAWDTGRKNKWSPRKIRRLSSREIAPMELDEFQTRLTAYLAAKRELAENGNVPLWTPKDTDAFL